MLPTNHKLPSFILSFIIIGIFVLLKPAYANDIITKDKTIIRINKAQSRSDATHSYYLGLLQLALNKANKTDQYTIKETSTSLSQGRALAELYEKDGIINIYQTGTTQKREKKFIPIRIPLLKGTLGYRINIIHKDNTSRLNNIDKLEQLSKLIACQGSHWPDSNILESANLKILRNASFPSMFLQTKYKRCDYFPRSIIEAYAEVAEYNDPDLVVYDRFIIQYKFPMYFFVSPHQPQLAKDIKEGLTLAINDGDFDRFFKNNTITKKLFPLSKWKNTKILTIDNKDLPPDTPINDPKLWIQLNTPNKG